MPIYHLTTMPLKLLLNGTFSRTITINFRHGWLHYTTDEIPQESTQSECKPSSVVQENFTHSDAKYAAYSTTEPKITAWKPKMNQK